MCRVPPAQGGLCSGCWSMCVCAGILCAGEWRGAGRRRRWNAFPLIFFLLYAPEFTAIKINLCESGLSLQDLVTFACLHIKFNNPVCESNHSHNNRSNLGCHLSGFGQERLSWAAGFQLLVGVAGWWLPGRFLCPGVSQSTARTGWHLHVTGKGDPCISKVFRIAIVLVTELVLALLKTKQTKNTGTHKQSWGRGRSSWACLFSLQLATQEGEKPQIHELCS